MIETVIARLELAVFDVAHEILRKQGVAVPEAEGDVDAAAQALLLRPLKAVHGAADDRALSLESKHQVGKNPSSGAGEKVATVGADEVGDDVATGPVAVGELAVVVRLSGRLGVLEPAV